MDASVAERERTLQRLRIRLERLTAQPAELRLACTNGLNQKQQNYSYHDANKA